MSCPYRDMPHAGNRLAGMNSTPPAAPSAFLTAVPCCIARDGGGRTARASSTDATRAMVATSSMVFSGMPLQTVSCLRSLWRSTSTACGGVYKT